MMAMQMTTDYQPIFRSLADPTRRAILCMLREESLCIGDIADHFQMTRPAVAKHLKILKESELIKTQTRGREKINTLNPKTLKSAMDWFSYFDRFWDDQLSNLKHIVENTNV